tara:strand:- start:272 stop:481 length:210 start_codon:yes stop_codon:yes gene_type:complete
MPYFREEDQKRKRTPEGIERTWSDEAHSVLVLAIQTIDQLDQNAATVELRQRLDLILNSSHWSEKRKEK